MLALLFKQVQITDYKLMLSTGCKDIFTNIKNISFFREAQLD